MKEMNGIHVKEKLESMRSRTKIIFISSYPERMPEAFGVNVLGFLKKPIDYKQFCEKTDKAIDICMSTDARCIFYNEYGKSRKLYIKDIVYIESLGRYNEIHITGESKALLSEKSMRDYRNELGGDFGMCYRSFLVNYKYVIKVEEEVVLEDGKVLPISRRYRATFVERFKRNICEEE